MPTRYRNETIAMYTGAQLRAARETAGWSQREAAKRLEIQNATLHRYEKGEIEVPLSIVDRARRVYGKPLCWFVDANYGSNDGGRDAAPLLPEVRSLLSTWPHERQRALARALPGLAQLWHDTPGG